VARFSHDDWSSGVSAAPRLRARGFGVIRARADDRARTTARGGRRKRALGVITAVERAIERDVTSV
jgi:hypothetical protein